MKEYLLARYITWKAQRVNASKVRLIFNFSNLSIVSSVPTFQLLLSSSSSSISVYKWYTKSVSQWPKWLFYDAMTAKKKQDTQSMRKLMQTNQSPLLAQGLDELNCLFYDESIPAILQCVRMRIRGEHGYKEAVNHLKTGKCDNSCRGSSD